MSTSGARDIEYNIEYGNAPTRSQRGRENAQPYEERRRGREESQPYHQRVSTRDVRRSSPTYSEATDRRRRSTTSQLEPWQNEGLGRSSAAQNHSEATTLGEGFGALRIEEEPEYELSASAPVGSAGWYGHSVNSYDSRQHDDTEPAPSSSHYAPRGHEPLIINDTLTHADPSYTTSASLYGHTDEPVVATTADHSKLPESIDPRLSSTYSNQSQHDGSTHLPTSEQPKPVPKDAETFDPSYVIRRRDYKHYFTIGRVFLTLWTEPFSTLTSKDEMTAVSVIIHGQKVYSKPRRFIVVREGQDRKSATCLPITSYSNAGVLRNGIQLSDHGFVYSKKKPEKVDGLRSKPLRVTVKKGARHLTYPSLVNYAKVHNIESHWKVKDVGELDEESKQTLLHYFRKVFSYMGSDQPSPGMTPPRGNEATLRGIGSGMDNYVPPTLPPGHQSSEVPSHHFASSTASAAYPLDHSREILRGSVGSTGYGYPSYTSETPYSPPGGDQYDSRPVQSTSMYENTSIYPYHQASHPLAAAAGRDFSTPQYSSQYSATNDYHNRQATIANTSGGELNYASNPPRPSWSSQTTGYADHYDYPTFSTVSRGYASAYPDPNSNYRNQTDVATASGYPSATTYNDPTSAQGRTNDEIELPSLEVVQQARPRRESQGSGWKGNRRRHHRDDRDSRR